MDFAESDYALEIEKKSPCGLPALTRLISVVNTLELVRGPSFLTFAATKKKHIRRVRHLHFFPVKAYTVNVSSLEAIWSLSQQLCCCSMKTAIGNKRMWLCSNKILFVDAET